MYEQHDAAFDGKDFVRNLTHAPGVYRMYDVRETLLYVGKAGNLKKRVSSYFMRPPMEPRIAAMVAQIARMETTVTRTESEALMLEAQLIKQLRPRYNILLRDGKSYPWVLLSAHPQYPRMAYHRGARGASGEYFGPFPSSAAVRESLNLLHKLFRVRGCEDSFFRNRTRPCLQYQIARCSAPCVALIAPAEYAQDVRHVRMFLQGRSSAVIDELSDAMRQASVEQRFERAARLRDQIQAMRAVQGAHYVVGASADMDVLACAIQGESACVSVLFFRNGMALGSRDFFPRLGVEEPSPAALLAQFIAQYYSEHPAPAELVVAHEPDQSVLLAEALAAHAGRTVLIKSQVRGDRARFLELAIRNAAAGLAARIASRQTLDARFADLAQCLRLPRIPARIECFDISHTQGEATVASCVAYGRDGPMKGHYRKFNISGIAAGDDYAAMEQALTRRFRRAVQGGEWSSPDLLLIDGGAGQVARAERALQALGVTDLPVVGVAKGPARRSGEETLVLAHGSGELHPGSASPALQLVNAVRDEAHRFAIGAHRRRREATRERSVLQEIPGIGPRRRRALLEAFGGLAGLEAAGVEEIARVNGIDRNLASRIYAALHG